MLKAFESKVLPFEFLSRISANFKIVLFPDACKLAKVHFQLSW